MDTKIIDLRRFWRSVKSFWWLYAVSVLLLGGASIYVVSRMMPKSPIVGEMLIGEESMTDGGAGVLAAAGKGAGGLNQMMKTFSVGGFGASAVDNEVLVLGSHDVLERTVKKLGINRTYVGKTAEGEKALLWGNSPVAVEAPAEFFDTLSVAFNVKVKLLEAGKADIVATRGFFKKVIAEADGVTLPTMLKTPYGNIQILRGETYDSSPYKELSINVSGNSAVAISLASMLDIDVMTKLSDVIEIKLEYANAELGKAIVDGVMAEYNSKRLDRLHETAVNSIKYYDERIAETLKRLETAEQEVTDYQKSTKMSAMEAEAKLMASMGAEGKANLLAAQSKKNYYERVLSSIKNDMNSDVLLPEIVAMEDPAITQYNTLIMERRDLRRSATDNNASLLHLNQRIAAISELIKDNARSIIDRSQTEIDLQASITGLATRRLSQYPDMEQNYISLSRDKEFQNALYLYLVQARENAVLKLYADTDLGYVFQPAYVQKPGLPVKSIMIVLGAIIFALTGSSFVALIVSLCQRRVRQPIDVAFIGLDTHAVNVVDGDESFERMRTKLLAHPGRKLIYMADMAGDEDVTKRFAESLIAAGFNVEEVSGVTTDELSNPDMAHKLAQKTGDGTYIMVHVENAEGLYMLEHAIDDADANLIVAVPDTMKRTDLKALLKGQTADRVYLLIIPDKK